MIFSITKLDRPKATTNYADKNSLTDLKSMSQHPSPLKGQISGMNRHGNAIFTTLSHSLILPRDADIVTGDELIMQIKHEGQQYIANILQKNGSSFVKQIPLTQAKVDSGTDLPSETVSLSTIKTTLVIESVKLNMLDNLLSKLQGGMQKTDIAKSFSVELTPCPAPNTNTKQPTNIGKIVEVLPNNKVIIETSNFKCSSILSSPLPLGSYVTVSKMLPLTTTQNTQHQTASVRTSLEPQIMHLLDRVKIHWPDLSRILQNLQTPSMNSMYARLATVFYNNYNPKFFLESLQQRSDPARQQATTSAQQKLRKTKVLLHTLSKELLAVSEKVEAPEMFQIQNSMWMRSQFPFFVDEKQQRAHVYIQRDKKQRSLRFILEPTFEALGKMQIEGVIYFENIDIDEEQEEIKSFQMTIHSHKPLPHELQANINEIFTVNREVTATNANIRFKNAHYFPIDMPSSH